VAETINRPGDDAIEGMKAMYKIHGNDRTCFFTRNGRQGLGPAHVAKDDVSCVFLGCSVPHILREEGAGFWLVGEAYV